jgi:CheY-like chemotaxis protein
MDRLSGMRVLVAEDEFLLAMDLTERLTGHGAEVIGPAGSLAEALDLVTRLPSLDFAILDVNLRSERVYRVASILQGIRVPFVFVTGYQQSSLPVDFRGEKVIGKPIDFPVLLDHLAPSVRA